MLSFVVWCTYNSVDNTQYFSEVLLQKVWVTILKNALLSYHNITQVFFLSGLVSTKSNNSTTQIPSTPPPFKAISSRCTDYMWLLSPCYFWTTLVTEPSQLVIETPLSLRGYKATAAAAVNKGKKSYMEIWHYKYNFCFELEHSQGHKNVYQANMDMSRHRLEMGMHSIDREANIPSELNDMLPKQKQTFVILFSWSAF